MRKYIVPLLILLLIPVWAGAATTYYVNPNCTGDPSTYVPATEQCTGGSDQVYDTIADINGLAATLEPGDTISFARGEIWREQLTIPESGTEGNVYTYTSHGTGDAPIISGADIVSTWIEAGVESGGVFVADAEENDLTDWTGSTTGGSATVAASVGSKNNGSYGYEFTSDGTNNAYVTKTFTSQTANSYYRIYIYIPTGFDLGAGTQYMRLGSLEDSGTERIRIYLKQDGGNIYFRPVLLSPEEEIAAPQISFDTWTRFEVAYIIHGSTGGGEVWKNGVSQGSVLDRDTSSFDITSVTTGIKMGNVVPSSGDYFYVDDCKEDTSPVGAYSGGQENLWSATLANDPAIVYFDGTVGTEDATSCPDNIDTDKEWCHTGTTLYQYSTSDPDERYDSPGTEAGARTYVINSTNRDYITIDGLTLEGSQSHGFLVDGGSYNIITNSTIRKLGDGNDYGVFFHADNYATADGYHTASNNSISDIRGDGIFVQRVREITITGNTIGTVYAGSAGNGGDNIQLLDSTDVTIANNDLSQQGTDTIKGCIVAESFDATASNFVIEENEVAYGAFGIGLYQADGAIVRYNYIHDTQGIGISGISDAMDDLEVYGNVIQDVTSSGINFCDAYDRTNFKIYNNVIEGTAGPYGVCLEQFDGEFKNNILWDSGPAYSYAYFVTVQGGGSVDSDYNVIGPESANYISYGGTAYSTLSAYQSGKSQDAHSTKEDPLFTAAASGDFTLQSTSPCIDAGDELNYAKLLVGSTWPSSVSTTVCGNRCEIGAYEYPIWGIP